MRADLPCYVRNLLDTYPSSRCPVKVSVKISTEVDEACRGYYRGRA
jgi:hypothetical protein